MKKYLVTFNCYHDLYDVSIMETENNLNSDQFAHELASKIYGMGGEGMEDYEWDNEDVARRVKVYELFNGKIMSVSDSINKIIAHIYEKDINDWQEKQKADREIKTEWEYEKKKAERNEVSPTHVLKKDFTDSCYEFVIPAGTTVYVGKVSVVFCKKNETLKFNSEYERKIIAQYNLRYKDQFGWSSMDKAGDPFIDNFDEWFDEIK